MLYTRIFILLVSVSILTSCAVPLTVVRMNPVSENVSWNYGQAFMSDTVAGVTVQAAFERSSAEHTIFDVEVTNLSSMDYLVDPAAFSLIKANQDQSVQSKIFVAMDPEIMLLNMDLAESQAVADEKNASTFTAVAATALVATAVVAAVVDDDTYEDDHYDDGPEVFITTDLVSNEPYQETQQVVDEARVMWTDKTLRKTTLQTYQKIVGKVFFPRFEDESIYILQIPVDDQMIEIPFQQKLFNPTTVTH